MPDVKQMLRSLPRPVVGLTVFVVVAVAATAIASKNILATMVRKTLQEQTVPEERDASGRLLTPVEIKYKRKFEDIQNTISTYEDEHGEGLPFQPAPDHVVPEDRLLAYFRVQNGLYDFFAKEHERLTRDKSGGPIHSGIRRLQFISKWAEPYLRYQQVLEEMSPEEHEWITTELYRVALWALNWYWDTREKNDRIEVMRNILAAGLDLTDPPPVEFGDKIERPERLDATRIPLPNRRYLFKYKSDFRWQNVNFDGIDLSGLDIMDPPPAVGPRELPDDEVVPAEPVLLK